MIIETLEIRARFDSSGKFMGLLEMECIEHAGKLYEVTHFTPIEGDDVILELWDMSPGGSRRGEARINQDGKIEITGSRVPSRVLKWWVEQIANGTNEL